jgi:hypothetical protein
MRPAICHQCGNSVVASNASRSLRAFKKEAEWYVVDETEVPRRVRFMASQL